MYNNIQMACMDLCASLNRKAAAFPTLARLRSFIVGAWQERAAEMTEWRANLKQRVRLSS